MDIGMLPYGIWSTDDGKEILFNRRYRGVWQHSRGSCKMIMVPSHITEFLATRYTERYFHTDGVNNPRRDKKAARRSKQIVADFITGKSLDHYVVT